MSSSIYVTNEDNDNSLNRIENNTNDDNNNNDNETEIFLQDFCLLVSILYQFHYKLNLA